MGKVKSISEVIIRLAGKLQGSATLCNIVRRFSTVARGVKVVVGGYASGVLTEDDAPFIWIYPDDSEFSCTGGFVKSFKAKIVVGVCPKKDAPSATSTIEAFESADLRAGNLFARADVSKNAVFRGIDCGPEETAAALKADYQTGMTSISTASTFAKAKNAAAAAAIEVTDFETANTSWSAAVGASGYGAVETSGQAIAVIMATAKGYAHDAGETALEAELEELIEDYVEEAAEFSAAVDNADAQRAALLEKYTEWIDDPYVTETVAARGDNSNGLVIFGSLRQFDAIRTAIYDIVKENDCGLIVDGFDCRCNSASHFPLDWTEATVSFSEQPAL